MLPPAQKSTTARQSWMAVLARAPSRAILGAIGDPPPPYQCLRGPESGTLMVRGRAGGTGSAFNLGEMTVTRCTLITGAGFTGHAIVAGTDRAHAAAAALADALLSDPTRHAGLMIALIEPQAAAQAAARRDIAGKAAATRVNFFTMAGMRA